jgi:hypothetical protein
MGRRNPSRRPHFTGGAGRCQLTVRPCQRLFRQRASGPDHRADFHKSLSLFWKFHRRFPATSLRNPPAGAAIP